MSPTRTPRHRWTNGASALLALGVLAVLFARPALERRAHFRTLCERLERVARAPARDLGDSLISLRVERLEGLLSTWQTIGGCGAGSSTGSGAAVKWIGRSTTGGLFNAQVMASYLPLPEGDFYDSGYNFSLTTQVTRDIGNKWNVGVVVPYLYKYYRNYYDLIPNVDISNGGLGDINLLGTRRFGEINNTALTLSLGIPTGGWRARYKNAILTQEKQLGNHRLNGGLTLDHTLDEIWGLLVFGGTVGYRGGENRLGNYRSPMGALYGYGGYFVGPFVPSVGLSLTHFLKPDRDHRQEQITELTTASGSLAVEWSSDYLAVLGGVSLPVGIPDFKLQPWVVALGFTVSPF